MCIYQFLYLAYLQRTCVYMCVYTCEYNCQCTLACVYEYEMCEILYRNTNVYVFKFTCMLTSVFKKIMHICYTCAFTSMHLSHTKWIATYASMWIQTYSSVREFCIFAYVCVCVLVCRSVYGEWRCVLQNLTFVVQVCLLMPFYIHFHNLKRISPRHCSQNNYIQTHMLTHTHMHTRQTNKHTNVSDNRIIRTFCEMEFCQRQCLLTHDDRLQPFFGDFYRRLQ